MTKIRYDFRSDTVTRPSEGMRRAMAEAEVGDDVFGDDPTVSRLEAVVAERLGKAAAVYVPSGTQSNLAALMSHCGRGEAFIAGQDAHCYRYEAGGAAVLGSLQPQPIAHAADGTLPIAQVAAAITGGGDAHLAPTRLIALENTCGGQVLPVAYMNEVAALARRHGLGLHLDGARAFNAAVKLGIDIAELAASFDTVSICLSKGLGAPVGSVLTGSAELIARARRLRKMLGGGMRQAGILAAAGLYALDHNIDRLAEDHARARRLAEGLARYPSLAVRMPDTNIVFVDSDADIGEPLGQHLAANGIGITGRYGQHRWVTHLDIDDAAVDAALEVVARFFDARQGH